MYIAAFLKTTTGLCDHCNSDCAITDIETIDASKLLELEDCHEDKAAVGEYNFQNGRENWLKMLSYERTDINPTSGGNAVTRRVFRYFRKSEMILVPMPPALEALSALLPQIQDAIKLRHHPSVVQALP